MMDTTVLALSRVYIQAETVDIFFTMLTNFPYFCYQKKGKREGKRKFLAESGLFQARSPSCGGQERSFGQFTSLVLTR